MLSGLAPFSDPTDQRKVIVAVPVLCSSSYLPNSVLSLLGLCAVNTNSAKLLR